MLLKAFCHIFLKKKKKSDSFTGYCWTQSLKFDGWVSLGRVPLSLTGGGREYQFCTPCPSAKSFMYATDLA